MKCGPGLNSVKSTTCSRTSAGNGELFIWAIFKDLGPRGAKTLSACGTPSSLLPDGSGFCFPSPEDPVRFPETFLQLSPALVCPRHGRRVGLSQALGSPWVWCPWVPGGSVHLSLQQELQRHREPPGRAGPDPATSKLGQARAGSRSWAYGCSCTSLPPIMSLCMRLSLG